VFPSLSCTAPINCWGKNEIWNWLYWSTTAAMMLCNKQPQGSEAYHGILLWCCRSLCSHWSRLQFGFPSLPRVLSMIHIRSTRGRKTTEAHQRLLFALHFLRIH
jgi:hypothetical protein